MMNIVIFGPPCSGKGTQSAFLVEEGFTHLSTGDMLRAAIRDQTDIGKQVEALLAAGHYAPDEIVIDLIKAEIAKGGDFLFDGFPRTIPQLDALLEVTHIDMVIELVATDDLLVERCVERGKTSGRADDNEETFRERLRVYREQTAPLGDAFHRRGIDLHFIPAARSVNEIAASIRNNIQERNNKIEKEITNG